MFSVDSASLFMSTSTCVRRDLGYRVPAPLWLCWWAMAMAMALALALAAGMQGLRGAGVANVSSSSNLRCTMSTKRRQMVVVVVVMIVVVRDVRLQERKS
jgi:uncharacterized RDD family membrane protein YckC